MSVECIHVDVQKKDITYTVHAACILVSICMYILFDNLILSEGNVGRYKASCIDSCLYLYTFIIGNMIFTYEYS